jgi:hypothetical protein
MKMGCLAILSFVHSVNLISHTSWGFTQVTGIFPLGHFLKGHASVTSGCSFL